MKEAIPPVVVDPESVTTGGPFQLSVIACMYNEAQNLPRFLEAVLRQSGPSYRLREVLCVASGCTDGSEAMLRDWERRDARLRIVLEATRGGKASALSAGLGLARGNVILLANADTLPLPGSFEQLVAPLRDPTVGLTCARLAPAPQRAGFTARLAALLWEVHDVVSQALPKSTGAVVFRSGQISLPADIEDDDTYLGILLGQTRGRSVYAREAVFLHRVPETPSELLGQRYRINRQVVGLRSRTGMVTSTWRPALMARCLARYLRQHPGDWFMLAVLSAMEGSVRILAMTSRLTSRRPLSIWLPVRSTKRAIDSVEL